MKYVWQMFYMTGFTVRIFRLLNFSYVQNNKNRKELVVPGTIKFPEHSNRV